MTELKKSRVGKAFAVLVGMVLCWGLFAPVWAQPPTLIYGLASGTTPTALRVGSTGKTLIEAAGNPCMDPNVTISSVAINISTVTTTQLVAPSGVTTVYVCGWSLTLNGTTPAVQFITGTGATCGTGTVTNTGTYLPTVGMPFVVEVPGTIFKGASGAGVCAVSTGTGPSIQGVAQYVQQ